MIREGSQPSETGVEITGVDQFSSSLLSSERRSAITKAMQTDLPAFYKFRKEQEEIEGELGLLPPEILAKTQWATVATTPEVVLRYSQENAEQVLEKEARLQALGMEYKKETDGTGEISITLCNGCRVSFAFYKKMCAYKCANKEGCRFCNLSEQNKRVKKVTSAQQLKALDDGLESTAWMGNRRTVFEILPDGSFLNEDEVSCETQDGMMARLSSEHFIHRVAIETRPEYCQSDDVKRLLAKLRPDQQLDIYFGLETTDEFVGQEINNKGYGFEGFKDSVKKLKNELTKEQLARLHISVYNIIKPAYITEKEALDLSLQMARDISEFSKELGMPIKVKYEPAVVSAGTLQEFLYYQKDAEDNRKFTPPNYFTIAELIARLSEEGLEKMAKFGQRDDIDIYATVAMISSIDNEKMFSSFDFMVYNAVQRFQVAHDVRAFAVDMQIAVEHASEFKKWEKELYDQEGESALSRLVKRELSGGVSAEYQERVQTQKKVWQVCDKIVYNQNFSERLARDPGEESERIKKEIKLLFQEEGFAGCQIKDFIFVDIGRRAVSRRAEDAALKGEMEKITKEAGFQIEIIIQNEAGMSQSVWIKIPLQGVPLIEKPDYIYNV